MKCFIRFVFVSAIFAFFATTQAFAEKVPVRAGLKTYAGEPGKRLDLKPRNILPKPRNVLVNEGRDLTRVIVKFADGLNLQPPRRAGDRSQRTPILQLRSEPADQYARKLLAQSKLTKAEIDQDIDRLNTYLDTAKPLWVRRLFEETPRFLERLRQNNEHVTGLQSPDLLNFLIIKLKNDQGPDLANFLNTLRSVEVAYLAPIPKLPDDPPVTQDFSSQQTYLGPAIAGDGLPDGIGASAAWALPGGRGEGIKVYDIEYNYNADHEDLPVIPKLRGVLLENDDDDESNGEADGFENHGTGVLGVMAGLNDGAGVTGIASDAQYAFLSSYSPTQGGVSVAAAISYALGSLDRGDVLLLEAQTRGPGRNTECTCVDHDCQYIPVEYDEAEFVLTQYATSAGVIVVAAAGNGEQDLDDSKFEDRFNIGYRNSGAIIVGASRSGSRQATCSSTYGSRIDVHAWGENVFTTGYGEIRVNGTDANQYYTSGFNGTSSASPIIAGTVASLQGIQLAFNRELYDWSRMRDLLRETGTRYSGNHDIGYFPDIPSAIASMNLPPVTTGPDPTPDTTDGQPPRYETTITFGDLVDRGHTGFRGTTYRLGNYGNSNGLVRLQFGERSDEPCYVRSYIRPLDGSLVSFYTHSFDECNNDRGPRAGSLVTVPSSTPLGRFIHGIQACTSRTGNEDRLKGARLMQSDITPQGNVQRLSTSPPALDRANCTNDWHEAAMCNSREVVSQIDVHYNQDKKGKSVSGFQIYCREVISANVCVNCRN